MQVRSDVRVGLRYVGALQRLTGISALAPRDVHSSALTARTVARAELNHANLQTGLQHVLLLELNVRLDRLDSAVVRHTEALAASHEWCVACS